MSVTELCRWAIAALLTGVLGWASFRDIRDRKIPNWTVLAVLALAVPWMALNPVTWDLWALGAGGLALLISFALYSTGVVGAGDSKLFAAVALFAGMAHLLTLALATAIAGGAIAAVSLGSRPRRALVMLTMRGKGDFGRGIPYGVAIAIGAALVVWAALLKLSLPEY